MNVTVEAQGFLLRRNWYPVLGTAALFVAGVLFLKYGSDASVPLAYLAAWFGLVLPPLLLARNAFPLSTPTKLQATEKGLWLGAVGDLSSEDILEAKVVPRRDAAVLVLAIRDGRTLTIATSLQDAQAIADRLGARRSRFRLVVPFWKRFLALFVAFLAVAIVAFHSQLEMALVTLPSCLLYAALLGWLIGYVRGRLVVGADGFTTRWLFRERFTAFRDVATIQGRPRLFDRATNDTMIALTSGRTIRLRTVEAPNTEVERGAESHAMQRHLVFAFDRSRQLLDASVDIPSLVGRGARSASEWLSSLDALVRGGGNRYRVAAVSPEMLADLATDPSAKADSRVGAAAALVRLGDERMRTRVRIAAEACAETELRDTLLALSDARDDVATEAALERCRATAPPR